ncbi:MAG: hypothetical protein COA78_26175 [Blastopirellula sp.]|nr:MAG: hypothetical protein COA78_26175 [Blastopirellula sp.]
MVQRKYQSGFSLLELLSVVVILGMIAAVGSAHLSTDVLANLSSDANAHQLLFDLKMARRRAIATGDDHRITFTTVDSKIVSYQIEQIATDLSVQVIDSTRMISADVDVTVTGGSPTFDFEGQATVAPTIDYDGPDKSWQINIIPVSGNATITQQ